MFKNFTILVSHYVYYFVLAWLLDVFVLREMSSDFSTTTFYVTMLITSTVIDKKIRNAWVEFLFRPIKLPKVSKETKKVIRQTIVIPKKNPKKQNKLKENPLND